MNTTTDPRIAMLAESCVNDMGDIFGDFDAARDAAGQYTDPRHVALEAVKKTLRKLVDQIENCKIYPAILREEYKTIIGELPDSPADSAVIGALVSDADWTDRGAREVVQLARRYGWSILRNSLALAEAMDIEDGEVGL